jgi:hypothetical protein
MIDWFSCRSGYPYHRVITLTIIIQVPGNLKVRHHFHLVQISFHVADAIRDYISQLLFRPTLDEGGLYINAWELEEVLDRLEVSISSTHNTEMKMSKGADDTLFILNIDFNTEQKMKYSYRDGFSEADLLVMAGDKEVLDLAEKMVNIQRKTRVNFPAEDKTSLFDIEGTEEDHIEREDIKSDTSNKQVHWRDAVATTRDWASR